MGKTQTPWLHRVVAEASTAITTCCAGDIPEQNDDLEPMGRPGAAVEEAYLKGEQALYLLYKALARAAIC